MSAFRDGNFCYVFTGSNQSTADRTNGDRDWAVLRLQVLEEPDVTTHLRIFNQPLLFSTQKTVAQSGYETLGTEVLLNESRRRNW